MRASVKVKGLNRLIANLKGLEKLDIYDKTISEVADKTVKYAKKNCPVKTGKLRNSIHKEKKSDAKYKVSAYAENKKGIDYAQFMEFGFIMRSGEPYLGIMPPIEVGDMTRGRSGYHPFLRPAQHKAIDEAGKIFDKKLRKAWK